MLSGEEPKRRRILPLRHRGRLRTSEPVPSQRFLQGLFGPQSDVKSPRGKFRQKSVFKVMRGLRLRNVSDDGHRWSLEPVVRSENHPVFVQPVKDYVMKRWGVFRSGSRNKSSTSASSHGTGKPPCSQRAASSTFGDSIQLSRRTQMTTMIQGSTTSLGHSGPAAEVSSTAPASRHLIRTSTEASQDLTDHAQTITKSELRIAVQRPGEDLPTENTDRSLCTEWFPCDSLQSSGLGQTRNRTSTSGTTVYNPPLIAEASPFSDNGREQ